MSKAKAISLGQVAKAAEAKGVLKGYGHRVHEAALHLCVAGANTDNPVISKVQINRVTADWPLKGSVTFTRVVDGQKFKLTLDRRAGGKYRAAAV